MNKAFNKVIKSHVLLAVLTVVAAVLLTTGVTYSLFQIQNKNKENQNIAVGTLDANLTSITGAMILDDLYPEKASSITDEDKKFEFNLENNGTFDLKYRIYLKDSTAELLNTNSSYSSYKKISSSHYKYINYKLDGSNAYNLQSIYEDDKFTILEGTLKPGANEAHYLQFFLDAKDTTDTGAPNDINGSLLSLDIYMDAYVSDTITDNIIASAKPDTPKNYDSGVYTANDNYGTNYYFRGNVEDNYVKFADLYWRIVRINGDGTMRLMYDGTYAHKNTDTNTDRVLTNVAYNSTNNVGYMYGNGNTNTTNSTIKTSLDAWYKENILDKGYSNFIADRIFCNDRGMIDETHFNAYDRLTAKNEPTLVCNNTNDTFTTGGMVGNSSLLYPVGLLSADELALAKTDATSYINKGVSYWTMTPSDKENDSLKVFTLDENGALTTSNISEEKSLVPVINLTKEYTNKMLGTGTLNDPYRVE